MPLRRGKSLPGSLTLSPLHHPSFFLRFSLERCNVCTGSDCMKAPETREEKKKTRRERHLSAIGPLSGIHDPCLIHIFHISLRSYYQDLELSWISGWGITTTLTFISETTSDKHSSQTGTIFSKWNVLRVLCHLTSV